MVFFKKPSNFFKKVNYTITRTTLKTNSFLHKFQFLYLLFNNTQVRANCTALNFIKKLQYNFFPTLSLLSNQNKHLFFNIQQKTIRFTKNQLTSLNMYIYSVLNIYSYWFLVTYKNNFKIKINTSIIARVEESNHFSINNTNLIETQALSLNSSLKCLNYAQNTTQFYNIFLLKLKPNFIFFQNWYKQDLMVKTLTNVNTQKLQLNFFFNTFFDKINYIFIYILKFIWFFKNYFFRNKYIFLKKYRFKPKKRYFGRSKFTLFLRKYHKYKYNFNRLAKSFFFFKKRSLFRKNINRTYFLWKSVSYQNKFLKQKFFNILKKQPTSQKLLVSNKPIFNILPYNINNSYVLSKSDIWFNVKFFLYACNPQTILLFLLNPWLLKMVCTTQKLNLCLFNKIINLKCLSSKNIFYSNLLPFINFNMFFLKKVSSLFITHKIREDFIPYYYHTLIRFFEHCSGKNSFYKSILLLIKI